LEIDRKVNRTRERLKGRYISTGNSLQVFVSFLGILSLADTDKKMIQKVGSLVLAGISSSFCEQH